MASSSGRQPNFAALNRGRHLYLAGRPSGWALAHILVVSNLDKTEIVSRYNHHHHHNHFTAFFPGPPGSAGAGTELLDFTVQTKISRGRHTNHPARRHSIRTNQCPPPPSPSFFTGRMPSCHPTNSQSTEGKAMYQDTKTLRKSTLLINSTVKQA